MASAARALVAFKTGEQPSNWLVIMTMSARTCHEQLLAIVVSSSVLRNVALMSSTIDGFVNLLVVAGFEGWNPTDAVVPLMPRVASISLPHWGSLNA